MKNKIQLNGLTFFAFHGAIPQERVVGNYFLLDLEVTTDFSKAMQNDRLNGTIDYVAIFEVLKREMQTPSKLLENVAGRLCTSLFKNFPSITDIHIKLQKTNPPIKGLKCEGFGVEVEMNRDELFE